MNNKKGFTLIELIVTITIIGLIGLIAIPSTKGLIDKSKEKASITQNNIILKAAEEYVVDISSELPTIDNTKYKIEIKTLIDEHHLNKNGMEFDLFEKDNKCIIVTFNSSKKKYNYEIENNCLNSYPSFPKINEGMIPVIIENNGTVKKADLDNWYNYEEKQWANAVLVTESSRNGYIEADSGSNINVDDILGYFVWIPRYKYKISTGGTNTSSSIDIVFENKEVTKSLGDAKNTYLTHPGFTFGDEELDGIWVAKFETTGTANAPTVLPNVTSLRNQKTSLQFETALKFNEYGITSDAHMMKNTEWATVAFLSSSKYGIDDEVRINNNSSFITGCGASEGTITATTDCHIRYGSDIYDFPQSTTKNITGIFDMAGGAWERVMGLYNENKAYSGFEILPAKKYYDNYESTDFALACNNNICLGHALTETKNWYNNYFTNLNSDNSWIYRGGYCFGNNGGGLFYINNSNGNASSNGTFRVVIVK